LFVETTVLPDFKVIVPSFKGVIEPSFTSAVSAVADPATSVPGAVMLIVGAVEIVSTETLSSPQELNTKSVIIKSEVNFMFLIVKVLL
jgi:hypothetical protein